MQTSIETMKKNNEERIENSIKNIPNANYENIARLLPELIAQQKLILDISIYAPHDAEEYAQKGVKRYCLYNHPDKENPCSIWIFAFASCQKTTIHDHKYKASVMILEGPVTERLYTPVPNGQAMNNQYPAVLCERTDRFNFHLNQDKPDDKIVHQLKRRKAFGENQTSRSLHIYNMEAYEVDASYRRNINQLFFSTKPSGHTSPAHTESHYQAGPIL